MVFGTLKLAGLYTQLSHQEKGGCAPHRHALVDVVLRLQRLEQDVKLVGDARVGALALGRQREAAPVLVQPQRPQQVRRVLRQEAVGRTGEVRASSMLPRRSRAVAL